MSTDRQSAEIDAMAKVLHDNGVCDVMFAHYGPAKKCERLARALADAGIGHAPSPAMEAVAAAVALGESWVGFEDSHAYGDALLAALAPIPGGRQPEVGESE